jgi:hypothetical protein
MSVAHLAQCTVYSKTAYTTFLCILLFSPLFLSAVVLSTPTPFYPTEQLCMPWATIQDLDFKMIIALAVARTMRRLHGDSGDSGPRGEYLFSKFRSSFSL